MIKYIYIYKIKAKMLETLIKLNGYIVISDYRYSIVKIT